MNERMLDRSMTMDDILKEVRQIRTSLMQYGVKLVSTAELAEMLHTSTTNIDRYRRQGTFPAVKVGKGYLFDKDAVIAIARERMGTDEGL